MRSVLQKGTSLDMPSKNKNKKNLVANKEPETNATVTETTETEVVPEETVVAEKPAKVKKEKAPKPPKEPKAKKDKPVRETPAHMAKVDKYAASLPTLSEDAKAVFAQAESLSLGELNVLSAHLTLLARRRATAVATTTKFEVGDRVCIHSGIDTRFIGKEGVVTRVQRARMFVKVANFDKDAYIFTSNAEHVKASKIDVSDDAPEIETKTAVG